MRVIDIAEVARERLERINHLEKLLADALHGWERTSHHSAEYRKEAERLTAKLTETEAELKELKFRMRGLEK